MNFIKTFMTAMLLCGTAASAGEPMTIVTTFYPMQIAVLNVTAGVEGLRVLNLVAQTTGCLHDYQLTPRDRATLSKADVVVANGAGMEAFLAEAGRGRSEVAQIDASAGIPLLITGGETNSHLWVSPSRHVQQVQSIVEGLAKWDPGHAMQYRINGRRYIRDLETLKVKMAAGLKDVKVRDIITLHEAFPYFADEFGLRVVAVIEREPGAEPSAGELAALIRKVRESGVGALFVEPQYPAKAAETIKRATGAGLYTLDPMVSGPVETNAYFMVMMRNLAELQRALK